MKPVIGLDCDIQLRTAKRVQKLEVYREYVQSIERAGGLPLLLPVVSDPADLEAQLDLTHGLILIGGSDLSPEIYGAGKHPKTKLMHPDRQTYDVALARAALRRGIPTLGICGGLQLVNVVCGGDLIQHVPALVGSPLAHSRRRARAVHEITVGPRTRLARILRARHLVVNSSHHQAVGRLGDGLRVSARSADGVVEALESAGRRFLLCVQWHPERLTATRPEQLALFKALVSAARPRSR